MSNYLSYSAVPNINIDSDWFKEKLTKAARSDVNSTDDNERTILRLENIKLDYLGSGSCAFTCFDNSGVNILQNIIPSNYSTSGYSIALLYDTGSDTLKNIGWLTSSSDLNEDFGGALYDAKNGIITFDMSKSTDADIEDLFKDKTFYFTATKYIGLSNINVLRSLEVIGDVSMESSLDISNNLTVHNQMLVDKDVSFGSHLQVVGDVSMESNLDIISDLRVKGNATFGIVGDHTDVSNNETNVYIYGDLRIMDGGNLVIEDLSNSTITDLRTEVKISDSIDISNDGTSTAMVVNQIHADNYNIVEFKDSLKNGLLYWKKWIYIYSR